jgi:hypothetical protein
MEENGKTAEDTRIQITCTSINPVIGLMAIGYNDGFWIYNYLLNRLLCDKSKFFQVKFRNRTCVPNLPCAQRN